MTPTAPQTPAKHHYQQAERTLATLGSLAATPEEATREAAAALVHAVLAIASLLIGQPDTEHWEISNDFKQPRSRPRYRPDRQPSVYS